MLVKHSKREQPKGDTQFDKKEHGKDINILSKWERPKGDTQCDKKRIAKGITKIL